MTDSATMAGLDPATLADVLRLAGSDGFDRIQDQITIMFLITPDEARQYPLSAEFDNPQPSSLW